MRPADQATDPAAGVSKRLVLAAVTLAGLGLMLFGANQTKIFGAAYLALLVGLFGLLPMFEWFERRAPVARVLAACRGLGHGLLDRCPWLPGALLGALGVLLCVYFGIRRIEFPPFISAFYVLLGLVLITCAVAPIPRSKSPDLVTGHRPWVFPLGLALAALPVAALGLSVVVYATNAPFFDEYISTLTFAANFDDMSRDERIAELIAAHFGHRIVFTRLVTLAQIKLFGELNFYALILFNYTLLCAGALLVYFSIRRPLRNPLLFAPFMFIFFQPQYHQITLWAFGSPHVSSLCLVAATLLFLARPSALGFWLALLCAIFAAFTFATGVFAGLVGLAVLLDQRRYREAVYWLVPISLLEMRYFSDFDTRDFEIRRMLATGAIPIGLEGKVLYALEFLGSLATLGVFSDFMGRSILVMKEFESTRYFARITGALFLALFAYVSLRRYWRLNPLVYGLLAIMVVSAALAADHRAGTVNVAYLSRYAFNSSLVAGLIYVALLQLHPRLVGWLLPVLLFAAALFCICSFLVTLPYARSHQRDLQFGTLLAANGLYQHATPVGPGLPLFRLPPLQKAGERGIYSIPERDFVAQFEAAPFDSSAEWLFSESSDWQVSYIGENRVAYMFFLGPADLVPMARVVGVVLVDQRGEALAFEATAFEDFAGHAAWIDSVAPDGATHYAVVPKSRLKAGPRRVAVATMDDRVATIHLTNLYVPTLRDTPPSLAPASGEERLHLTSVCSVMAVESDGGCWFEDTKDGLVVELPENFTVQLLAQTTGAGAGNLELWRIDFGEEAELRSLRLSLEHDWFALAAEYIDGTELLAKVEAGADAPSWVAVAVARRDVTLLAASPNDFGALAELGVGEGELRASLDNVGAFFVSDGTNYLGLSAIRMREISLREGAMTVPDVEAAWPLFDADVD